MTLMWEAVAAPGRADDLVAHVLAHAPQPAQIYRSGDDRVVVIDPTGVGVPDPPVALVRRAAHSWTFDEVARG